MERVDVSIIGGGPVGLFGAFYAGLRGMSVRIVDSLPELGGQLTALYPEKYVYDMPGFPRVLAKDLAAAMIEQGTQFGPEVKLERMVVGLEKDDEGWVLETSRGERLPTRTVVLAAGTGAFTPTKIGLPDEDQWVGKGLFYGVKSKEPFVGKRVAIVGGGDSAFDWAINLFPVAQSVSLIHRRDGFRAHEESVREAERLGVEFRLWQVVSGIHGNGQIEAVTLTNTQTKQTECVEVDIVCVNIGFKSSIGALKGWGMVIEKNKVMVNHMLQTNLPGVFAVGDICIFDGKLHLIATGVAEAVTAVCVAKTLIDPTAKLFPGHSTDMESAPGSLQPT